MKQIVDLSLTLSEHVPCTWPGMKTFSHTVFKNFPSEEDPCRTCYFIMDEHCGTHCDAPGHFVQPQTEDDRILLSGESLNLASMQGDLAVIDVREFNRTAEPGKSPIISPETISEWEIRHHQLQPGEIVAFMTGWDKFYYAEEKEQSNYLENPVRKKTFPGWPTPSGETIVFLYEKGIRCLAIDAPSIGAIHDGVVPHQIGLTRRMIYIEGLTALDKVPAEHSYFLFLPLKLADSSGCPGRAIAYI